VAGPPEVDHGHDRNQASGVKAGGRAVEADIERRLFLVEHFPHGRFVGHLGDEAASLQFIKNRFRHGSPLFRTSLL
jgi:hypothetical protein